MTQQKIDSKPKLTPVQYKQIKTGEFFTLFGAVLYTMKAQFESFY